MLYLQKCKQMLAFDIMEVSIDMLYPYILDKQILHALVKKRMPECENKYSALNE